MKPSWAAHCFSFRVPSRLHVDVGVNPRFLVSDRVWFRMCLYDMYRGNFTCNFTTCYQCLFHVNFKQLATATQLSSLKLHLTPSQLCEPFHTFSAHWRAQVSLDLHKWLMMETRVVLLNVQQWYMHCNPQFELGIFTTKIQHLWHSEQRIFLFFQTGVFGYMIVVRQNINRHHHIPYLLNI